MTNDLPRPADPIIRWPGKTENELRTMIADLQRLNPTLNLRCAVERTEAEDRTARVSRDGRPPVEEIQHTPAHEAEFLVYDGTALEVVSITMPELPTDDMLAALTRQNREAWSQETDLGPLWTNPRRIERTAAGLLIRPRSDNVGGAINRFEFNRFFPRCSREEFSRIIPRWGVVRDRDEVWEFDFAYLPANHYFRPDGTCKSNREWWSTTPIGTISYIDQYDLPIEKHDERARAVVEAGSKFAVVGDLRIGELRIFRQSGVERVTKAIRIPEMRRFKIPLDNCDELRRPSGTERRKQKRSI